MGTASAGQIRVLHVVASETRRGAEVFASDLVRALSAGSLAQRVGILRGSPEPTVRFEADIRLLGSESWTVPGLRLRVGTLRALRQMILEWDPAVVQAHGGEALKYALAAARWRKCRVVYRRIGSAPPWITRGPRRAVYARLMRRADRIVAVADAVRQDTIEMFGIPREQVVTIPNAVDTLRLQPGKGRSETRRFLGVPLAAPLILSIGAFTWEKDPAGVLEVGEAILSRRRDAIHLIVGDGPLRGEVDKLVRARGSDGRVRLLGARGDVADLLHASDLLLFASRSEGMPAIVIEAGMAGLPVAAYAVAGVPEIVVDGGTGVLTSAGDVRGLAARVLDLLETEELRSSMGSAARARCRTRFDIRTVAPRYAHLYWELAEGRGTRPTPLDDGQELPAT